MSQANDWRWEQDHITKKSAWQRVRTISLDFAEPILKLLQIPGAFVPGAKDALRSVQAMLPEDLEISALDHPSAIMPLDGRAVLKARDGSEPVFVDGFQANFTLVHSGNGSKPILLERMDLQLVSFTAGRDPYYEREIEELLPAGIVEPTRFFIEVGADGPLRARRVLDPAKSEMSVANSDNFFDSDAGSILSFGPNESPQVILVTASALDPGLYELCFRFFFRVGAREIRQHTTRSLAVYCQ